MRRCHSCGQPWESEKKVPGVKEFCEKCSAYLHCCLNCRHYEPAKHNQCAIPTTDWVGDKAGANFCDEFEFAVQHSAGGGGNDAEGAARERLGKLFGEEPGVGGADNLDKFKGLFDD